MFYLLYLRLNFNHSFVCMKDNIPYVFYIMYDTFSSENMCHTYCIIQYIEKLKFLLRAYLQKP